MPEDNGIPADAAAAAAAAVGAAGTVVQTDAEIEALNLSDIAKAAAYILKRAHPSVHFTSGRRDRNEQASAMASNVVLNRQWIREVYVPSPARDACQKWVDAHPDQTTKQQIAAGLASVLNSLSVADVGRISKHLSGDAFDVQPVQEDADAIKQTIRGLPGLGKFLEREGGLERWHAQF